MKSPFKFLDSYTKEDWELFFGREREIEELYHRIFESRILLVYGVSGTGKSSLINCGLANKFQESDWLPLVVRRGSDIIRSMVAAIKEASVTQQQSKFVSPNDFRKGVRSLYLDHYKPVFFIFDQFEELFIFGSKEERRSFISIIKALFESDLQCRLLFVMREEYMAGVTEFEKYIPTFFSNRVRIEKMSHHEALEAIKGPCNFAGISIEEGFAEALLEKLSPGSPDVELTYLQVFLDKIFRLAQHSEGNNLRNLSFDLSLLQGVGNVSDILGSFLDEQISLMDDPDIALTVLKSFVSVRGTKKQMSPDDISEYSSTTGKPVESKSLTDILQALVNIRILKDKDQDGRYELRHDSLATKIFEKITLVEREILEVRQFVENAYNNFEKRHIYLGPEDLSYIAPYEDKLFINKRLSEFIEDSKKNTTAKKRAFSRILRYSAAGFLLLIIAILFYYLRSDISHRSDELATISLLQKDFSPALSFNYAMQAYKKDTTSTIAVKALFSSFYSLLENGHKSDTATGPDPWKTFSNFMPCSSEIKYTRFSKDGKFIYGFLKDRTIKVWDINGQTVFSKRDKNEPVISLKMSPDNKFISAVYWDSTATIWNMDGKKIYETRIVFDPLNPLDVVDFSPDKNIMLLLKGENSITVFNLEDSSSYDLTGHLDEVNGAVFSPDGKFIASASKDSTAIVWLSDSIQNKYVRFRTLRLLRGIVWSVDFARNSKYVLVLSEGRVKNQKYRIPVMIVDLNGRWVEAVFFESDSAIIAKYSWSYKGFCYSAKFTARDAGYRLSSFSNPSGIAESDTCLSMDRSEGYKNHRIRLADNSLFGLVQTNRYVKIFDRKMSKQTEYAQKKYDRTYSFIDASRKYTALNKTGEEYSILSIYDGLPVMKFRGKQPCFSPDGKYLMCIDGDCIKLYPAEENELIRLADKVKIFGEMNSNRENWIYFK